MASSDKTWAKEYLLDPLTAPQPSEETGPGTSFRARTPEKTSGTSVATSPATPEAFASKNPYRKSSLSQSTTQEVTPGSPKLRNGSYPSPPLSASPKHPHSPSHRQEAFGANTTTRPRRSSSLTAKHPGDMSHRPLDQLTKEKAIADRSRHVTKKHLIAPDTVDSLDNASGATYHHSGPYDATLYARNNSRNSPLAALADSNAEALKATPKEKIVDSVQGHRPLDGVAAYEPGQQDREGHTYTYEAGENMMVDNNPGGGAYKRWPGIQYHPDDIKGKGEPSYSIEKALKEHSLEDKQERSGSRNGEAGIEMKSRSRPSSQVINGEGGYDDGEGNMRRSGSFGKGLRKRIGSIKKQMHRDE